MINFIYDLGILICLALGLPFLLIRLITTRRFRAGLGERFAVYGRRRNKLQSAKSIWIQAASVGEVTAALPLIKLLREEFPDYGLVLTCQTDSGRQIARARAPSGVSVFLCPLDLSFLVRRFIRLASPRVLVLIETELWPGLIAGSRKEKIPVVVASGRISASAFNGYAKVAFLMKRLLREVSVFNMRTEEDASRIKKIGAPVEKVFVTGNIKFDALPPADLSPECRKHLSEQLGLPAGGTLLIGGSTFEGEEAILVDSWRELSPCFPGLRLLLAPRHLERVGEVEELLKLRTQPYALYSHSAAEKREKGAKVVILDKMGVLFNLYDLAAVVFMGRSLCGQGGQNPIEPASWGKPVLFGPHMENFRDIAEELVRAGGAVRLADKSALTECLKSLISQPDRLRSMGEKAREIVTRRQGASRRNLETIRRFLVPESGSER